MDWEVGTEMVITPSERGEEEEAGCKVFFVFSQVSWCRWQPATWLNSLLLVSLEEAI